MIKKLKVVLMCVMLACSATLAAGCATDTSDENKKYDVAIKVACKIFENEFLVGYPMHEVEFAPNESEKTIEINWTGASLYFYVTEYKLVGHPNQGEWVAAESGPSCFHVGKSLYCDLEGNNQEEKKFVKEKGKYLYNITVYGSPETANPSPSWDYRSCQLTVIVK